MTDLRIVNIFWFCYCSSQFAQVNRNLTVEDCNNLPPGKTICLGYVDHDCWDTQTVQPGDTCKKIAEENGVSEDTLCANNEQVGNECKIYGGEVRCAFFFFPIVSYFLSFIWTPASGVRPKILNRPNNLL